MSTSGLHRNRRYLELLRRLGEEAPDRRLFTEVVDSVLAALGAERVFLFRFRKGGGFRVLVGRNIDGENIPRPQEKMSHHAVRKMEKAGTVWVVPDARQDRRYRSEDVLAGSKPPRSILLFPLRARGEILGGMYADHRFQSLDEKIARKPDVQAWVGLCTIAVALRDQRARLRWLEKRLENGRRKEQLRRERPEFWEEARLALPREPPGPLRLEEFHGLWSANPDVLDQFDSLRRLAASSIPILICGETGVGKSLLARAVHESSIRAGRPFETVSCGALPDTLMESELAGYKKGAFTGAESDHSGVIAHAHGGTLYLDEVGDLTLETQTKLLRVLEDGKIRPLGGKDVIEVDVRIVSSTSHDLERLVREGRFRRDLYFRLKNLVIEIPPLRERREDTAGLARLFLQRYSDEGEGKAAHFRPDAMQLLLAHTWPGNVRELENEVRRLAALGHAEIGAENLSPALRAGAYGGPNSAYRCLDEVVSAAERDAILDALRRCGGNKSRAAGELGITRKALYRRLRKYGIGGGRVPVPDAGVAGRDISGG